MESITIDARGRDVTISIAAADALATPVDALALKYAQRSYGVDKAALQALRISDTDTQLPEPGEAVHLQTRGTIAAPMLIMIGTVPLQYFEYAEIRDFARRAVVATQSSSAQIRHLGMTMHGVGAGLDETESFIAEVAGLLDALRRDEWPAGLVQVTIFEADAKRAERIAGVLRRVLPRKLDEQLTRRRRGPEGTVEPELVSAGLGSRKKPHVFVAMQFGAETDDLFHYGIQAAVQSNGYLCERIDNVSFTGDILAQIKARIDSASFVVADVSAANPNVYLEVGYAWGRNVKTVLLAREASQLRFDVQGQRCILYSSIRDLEQKLTEELRQLEVAAT